MHFHERKRRRCAKIAAAVAAVGVVRVMWNSAACLHRHICHNISKAVLDLRRGERGRRILGEVALVALAL